MTQEMPLRGKFFIGRRSA